MTTNIALIGWSGCIGQELAVHLPDGIDMYNSSNIESMCGKSYDIVYCTALPAEKWKINQSPAADAETISKIQSVLQTVSITRFILISTVDVFQGDVCQDEDGHAYANHPYGTHRHMFEDWVCASFPSVYIFRLPGLFGKGIKKNVIYDLLFQNNLHAISLDSEFQYYNIGNLYSDIQRCIANDVRYVQFVSEPISTRVIVERYFPEYLDTCVGGARVRYCLTTKHGRSGEWWSAREDVLSQLGEYIAYERALQRRAYAVSAIAWDESDWTDVEKILRRYRVRMLEYAPGKFGSWDTITPDSVVNARKPGYTYISCQSILYNAPCKFFDVGFIEHYEQVLQICMQLGTKVIVFGSPKQRSCAHLSEDERIAWVRRIGDMSQSARVLFCLEHNAREYGCDWLTTATEVAEFVQRVNHPAVRMNYDTGNELMDPSTFPPIEWIGHAQVSYRNLTPLSGTPLHEYEQIVEDCKKLQNHPVCVSLEMRQSSMQTLLKSIDAFINAICA